MIAAPKIGKVAFAAFLKNWRRDCNSSFRFFSLIAFDMPYRYLGVGLVCLKKKRRNLYLLPSYWSRLLALPYQSRTATQKPTPVYAINASGYISPEILCRKQDNHISTGIYRCSIPDFDMKVCETFRPVKNQRG